jgi:hypothetical protein
VAKNVVVHCCCFCASKKLKPHDPDFEGYTPGVPMGVVYGEEITGGYSWDDTVIPIECENSHVFYVKVDP